MEVELSVIVPAYNEEKRIGACLASLSAFAAASPIPVELIVVDDHSKDGTAAIVRRHIDENPGTPLRLISTPVSRKGKGAAVNTGMSAATGKFRLFTDVDLSTPISEVNKLLFWARQGVDVVFGSRSLKDSDVRRFQPWHRRFAGAAMRNLTRLLILPGVRDTQCGFKLFSEKAALEVFPRQRVWGWSFDLELLLLAKSMGFSLKEVPVIWIDSPESKVRFIKDAPKMLMDILAISLRLRLFKRIPKAL
ncbi:MAG: glycosyltransferase family 2 protein [bacterium]|jgi:dolichyl-phosphate beta-glucosyltransferase